MSDIGLPDGPPVEPPDGAPAPVDPRPFPFCTFTGCANPVAFISDNGRLYVCSEHFWSDHAHPAPWVRV